MPVLQQHAGHDLSVQWDEFAAQAPELAEFGPCSSQRYPPPYLAPLLTIRAFHVSTP
jgi:hypothetical protein